MIYFVRHGESEANAFLRDGGVWSFDKHNDSPLTERGRGQARDTAEKLKNKNIDIVVTSGMKRAKETADIINGGYHDAPVVEYDGLNERWDKRDGARETHEDEWQKAFEFGYDAEEGIERLEDFRDRVVGAMEQIREKYGDDDILIVAHEGMSHVLRRYFGGGLWEGNIRMERMGNGEVVEFDFGM